MSDTCGARHLKKGTALEVTVKVFMVFLLVPKAYMNFFKVSSGVSNIVCNLHGNRILHTQNIHYPLHNSPVFESQNGIGDLGYPLVVGDNEEGCSCLFVSLPKKLQDLVPCFGIQVACRLIA